MASDEETEGPFYVVYLPDSPRATPYPFTSKKGALVAKLERAIHALWDKERGLNGKTIYLYKCGDLSKKPEGGDLYGDALKWLCKDDLKPKTMDSSDRLDEIFPDGPTPHKKKKIDVIVATDSILVSLGLLKDDISTGMISSLKRARLNDDDAAIRAAATSAVDQPSLDHWLEDKNTDWNTFYEYWSNKSFKETYEASIIPLALDNRGYEDPSYRLNCLTPSQDQILVLDVYRRLFGRVIAFKYKSPERGVLVTGQPGTGKTTWLWFMLICLIMRHEVVAFYYNEKTRLLYNGRIYSAGVGADLPPSFIKKRTIWCLIDSDPTLLPPPSYLVSKNGYIFPVQAASPNDARYKIWSKERNPATFGMPLWSEEELKQGFRLQSNYTALQARLQKEMEIDGVASAMEKYGNAPRDVYKAIGDLVGAEIDIDTALTQTNLEALVRTVSQLSLGTPIWREDSFPHKLLAIDPKARDEQVDDEYAHFFAHHAVGEYANFLAQHDEDVGFFAQHDDFIPRFRTERIGSMVMNRVGFLQLQQAQQLFRVFKLLPQSSTLGGWIFESLVQGVLSNAEANSDIERVLIPMDQEEENGLHYTLSSSADRGLFCLSDRKICDVELPGGEFDWPPAPPEKHHGTALEDALFVPKRPNNPLFDSFFVEFEEKGTLMTPVVWIFQITTSPTHKGSKKGWPIISRIASTAAKRAKERVMIMNDNPQAPNFRVAKVKVKYVLVRPYPVQKCSWTMPEGRALAIEGDAFCLFVNFEAFGTSRPIHTRSGSRQEGSAKQD